MGLCFFALDFSNSRCLLKFRMVIESKLNNMYSLVLLLLYKLKKKAKYYFRFFSDLKNLFFKKTLLSNFRYRFHIGIAFATKQPGVGKYFLVVCGNF